MHPGGLWRKARSVLTWHLLRQAAVYGVIGVFAAGLDLVLFVQFRHWGMALLVANTLSVHLGMAASFACNAYLNFRRTDRLGRRALSFLLVGWTGLAMSSGILTLTVSVLGLNETASKAGSIVFVGLTQFALNKAITFRTTREHNNA
ncbi:MAG: GtrA family protein [Micrococcales bacterium]|nr:GtrA family protein [Micrococcales bacterium]